MNGKLMRREMSDQPDVLARLGARREDTVGRVRAVVPSCLAGVLLLARGSSDHAALHARYLIELTTGRPAGLAAPSLWTRYGATTSLTDWVVIAVSQSGRTPEIVEAAERMRQAGAIVVSVTNHDDSDLAAASDAVVPLGAGDERAVPATKTFTASVLALTHVAAALGDLPWNPAAEQRVSSAVAAVIDDEGPVEQALDVVMDRETVHVGRGYTLPVALESALKVKETTTKGSHGYASADFLHGPVAAVDTHAAVFGYAASGPTYRDVRDLLTTTQMRGIVSVLVTDAATPFSRADQLAVVSVPGGLPEPLAAIPLTVRAQQLAYSAAMRAGLDPDRPAGLNKVTITY
jgi:glucosamine--fructose-6-phosphate aminotransferase (isomerizing)